MVTQKIARKGGPMGRPIPPGSTAKVDWERVEKEDLLVGQHAYDDHFLANNQGYLQERLARQEATGDHKGAAKTKRQLGYAVEGRLAIRSSWCPTCLNYLHNCQCEAEDTSMRSPLVLQLIHNILAEGNGPVEDKAQRKADKKMAAKAAKKARKEQGK